MFSTHSPPDSNQGPSLLATISSSKSPAISKTSPALKDENNSIGNSPTSGNDSTTQRQILPRPGVLIVSLHEAVGISLPEHYKQLLNEHKDQQGTEPGPNTVSPAANYLESSGSYKSEAASKRPTCQVYALLDFDKSQVLVHASSGTVENPIWAGHSFRFDFSHAMELSVYLYLKNALSTPASGRIQDICLGVAQFSPRFEDGHSGVKGSNALILHQEWLEVRFGTGKIRVSVDFSENKTQLLQIQDFDMLKVLGIGRPEKTFQVQKNGSWQFYALKKIRKASIVSQAEAADAFEIVKRSVLYQVKNPFLVPVKFVFQSTENLYLVLAFVHGGELIELLYKEQCFDMDSIRRYTAEILCALECLHDFGIIYGNLKPENILLDYSGHISICDFGLCKLDTKDNINKSCGCPFLAPEISLGQAYTEAVDWWTLGILLAQMLTGFAPSWYDENITGIDSFYFSDPDVVAPLAKDISIKLFNRDPEQRLGAKGIAEIKAHPFFDDIDWRKILQRQYEPVIKPNDAHVCFGVHADSFDFPLMSNEEAQKLSDEILERFDVVSMFAGFSAKGPDGIVRVVGDTKAKEDSANLISDRPAT